MENLFYTTPGLIQGNRIELEGQEAHHAVKVLRYRAGDTIVITDGTGTFFSCVIRHAESGFLSAEIVLKRTVSRPGPYLAVAVGNIKKRDRLEFAVEKITELGADEILIFYGDHSEKNRVREDRLRKTIESAMKQSLRPFLPVFKLYTSLENLVSEKVADGFTIVAADEELQEEKQVPLNQNKYLLVVGPEGGFSEKERTIFDRGGVLKYSLGNYRLRTETAAIIITDHFRNRRF